MRWLITLYVSAGGTAYTVLTTTSLAVTIGCGVVSIGLLVKVARNW